MRNRIMQWGHSKLAVKLAKRQPARKTRQERLEKFGVAGIRGLIDEENAKIILFKKQSAPEIKRVVPGLVGLRIMEKRYRENNRKKREKIKNWKKDARGGAVEKGKLKKIAREEAKKIFSAKPYDPHKTGRSGATYKRYL